MKKWQKRSLWLLLVLGVAAGLWWAFKPAEKVNYLTDTVKRSNIEQTVNATGEVSAAQMVDVGAQASGQIKKLHVKLGQKVKKGDLIADIDATTQTNNLNTNRARLDTYQAQLASAQIKLRTAERQYAREQALWKEDATSKQSLESAEDALAGAKASVTELKSSIRQTQIAINTAEADLGYTRITAPMDGTVVAIPVEEGQTVNANQTTPTIVQVADLSTMLNKMQIAEGDVNKVKAGMKLTFTTLSQPDNVREATLESIDPGLTTMSQGSYTTSTDTTDSAIYYYARSLVPNEDNVLHIGMTTENTIIINQAEKVLAVPKLAVKQRGGKQYVRVLGENNQPQEKEITTGLSDNMNTEVKSGLGEGENVIISEAAAGETSDSVGRGMGRPPM